MKEVVKLGMILDVHTEHEEIDYMVSRFPEATIVFPHFGDEKEYDHIFSINDPSTVLARIHHSFLTEEQKARVLAGNLEGSSHGSRSEGRDGREDAVTLVGQIGPYAELLLR